MTTRLEAVELVEVDRLVHDGPAILEVEATKLGMHQLQIRRVGSGEGGRYQLRVETRTAAEQEAAVARRRAESEEERPMPARDEPGWMICLAGEGSRPEHAVT